MILKAPICTGENVGKAFFMIKNEEPHMVANRQSNNQAMIVLFCEATVGDDVVFT